MAYRAGEGHQVAVLRRIQAERIGDRVEQGIRGLCASALFQTLVIVGAEPCQNRDLLASQAFHPAAWPRLQTKILGLSPFPTRPGECSEFSCGGRRCAHLSFARLCADAWVGLPDRGY